MSVAHQDWVPLTHVQQRYGIKRTAVEERLAALGICPVKRDRTVGIMATDLEHLDVLYQHLEVGGTLDNFDVDVVLHPYAGPDEALMMAQPAEMVPANQAQKLAAFVDAVLSQRSPIDPIQDLTQRLNLLEQAAAHEWLLPTSDLATALGLSRRSVGRHQQFDRYGFQFSKAGHHGSETAWRVEKLARKQKQKKKSKH